MTLKETNSSLEKLRHFLLQSEVNVEVFETLIKSINLSFENTIEKMKLSSMKQKTITDYFKN